MIVLVIAFSQFSILVMFSAVSVTLPAMGVELGASGVQLGLVETLYLAASAALVLPLGRLADLSERRTLFKLGLALFTLTTLAIGVLPSVESILACRLLQGVGSALLAATGMAILTDAVPAARRGRAIGIAMGALYTGLAAGPFVGGLITDQLGWRWVYVLCSAPMAVCLALSLRWLPGVWRAPREPVNAGGGLLIVAAMAALIAGSATLGRGVTGYALIALGVVLGGVFVAAQERSRAPLLRVSDVAANRELTAALLIQLTMYSGAFAATFLFSLYLQIVKDLSAQTAGQLLLIGPLLMTLIAPLSGYWSDRVAPQKLSAAGAVLILSGTLLATALRADSVLSHLIAVTVLQSCGFALLSSPNMSIILGSVSGDRIGVAAALAAKMRTLGMVFSMLVITVLMSLYLGGGSVESNPEAFGVVMTQSFVTFSLLVTAGVCMALRRAVVQSG